MSEKKQQSAYPLRMPQDLRERLEVSATQGKRSLNAEIIARLEASYDFIPQSRDVSHSTAMAEFDDLDRQRSIVMRLRLGKVHAISALREEAEAADSSETKAALEAAISVAFAELNSLSDQEAEIKQRYKILEAQLQMNARAPKD